MAVNSTFQKQTTWERFVTTACGAFGTCFDDHAIVGGHYFRSTIKDCNCAFVLVKDPMVLLFGTACEEHTFCCGMDDHDFVVFDARKPGSSQADTLVTVYTAANYFIRYDEADSLPLTYVFDRHREVVALRSSTFDDVDCLKFRALLINS